MNIVNSSRKESRTGKGWIMAVQNHIQEKTRWIQFKLNDTDIALLNRIEDREGLILHGQIR